jgi:hypothetical protein
MKEKKRKARPLLAAGVGLAAVILSVGCGGDDTKVGLNAADMHTPGTDSGVSVFDSGISVTDGSGLSVSDGGTH